MKKVMTIFGTRPEAIKMAPLVLALKKNAPELTSRVVVTAQHREMLDQVLDFFHITPDYDLDIMQNRQSLTSITVRVLKGLEAVLKKEAPDVVLVHGDTTTTMAASLAAFYQKIPVGHVEAGLRTNDKYAPYPEEMNRKMAGALADLHFAPTINAKENLIGEGVDEEAIFVTGNTAIDALLAVIQDDFTFSSPLLNELSSRGQKMVLVDAHRRENLGEPMEEICRAIKRLVSAHQELEVVFSVHKNPQVSEVVEKNLGKEARIHLLSPLDYVQWANLMNQAWLIITDSGGLQEEAPALQKPVLLLRNTTERPEAIDAKTVWMVGTKEKAIYEASCRLLSDKEHYGTMCRAVNPYGDGYAAQRIVKALLYVLGEAKEAPDEFSLQNKRE